MKKYPDCPSIRRNREDSTTGSNGRAAMTVIIMIIMHHDDDHGRRKLSCSLPRSSSVQQRKLRPGRACLCLSSTTPPIIMSDERIAALEAQVASMEQTIQQQREDLQRERATTQQQRGVIRALTRQLSRPQHTRINTNVNGNVLGERASITVNEINPEQLNRMEGMLQVLTASLGQNGGSAEPGQGVQQEQGERSQSGNRGAGANLAEDSLDNADEGAGVGREQDGEQEQDESGWFPPRFSVRGKKRSHDDE
jgi:uncharacterized coiled-coil protein SlyX